MSYKITTKRNIHVLTNIDKNMKVDAYVGLGEYASLKEIKEPSKTIIVNMPEDLNDYSFLKQELQSLCDTKLNKIIINNEVVLDGFMINNIIVDGKNIIIKNCIINDISINNISGYIMFINDTFKKDVSFNNLCNGALSISFDECKFSSNVSFSSFINNTIPLNILFENNIFYKNMLLDAPEIKEDMMSFVVIKNTFYGTIYNNFEYLYFIENEMLMENIDIICLKETGYPLKNTFKILDEPHFKIKPYVLLDVKNIPQYLSNINDPALQTGCEATACAIALSYMLKKNITKNEIASLMPKASPNEASFWDSFIGDIYHDGWGCMSTVAYNAIIKYLESHDLIDKYEVVNYTNTPLYKLLYLVSQGIPVIAYATMGNENTMYSRKYGSTIFNVNNNVLKWPGRDHCLVIIGYNLNTKQIYVADPEENSTAYRVRDLYLFENRFMQLYLQSIVILPIVQNDKNNN